MPRKSKKYHFIYKTTCQVTGKFYVGMHSTDDLEDGYLGSGKILGYSRVKHGDENHKREILEFVESREALKLREKQIVNEELLAHPLNINLKYGGEGGSHGRETEMWARPEHRAKVSESIKSLWLTNHKKMSNGVSKNMLNRWKNSTDRHKMLASSNTAFLGKHHTSETKQKMSAAAVKRTGEKNSQFETCWVTKNNVSIKIKNADLDQHLNIGYTRGRVIKR